MKICLVKVGVQMFILGLRYIKIHFVDIELVFFKVFLRKIISTISNFSYTSQIHCRNALRLDPVLNKDVMARASAFALEQLSLCAREVAYFVT